MCNCHKDEVTGEFVACESHKYCDEWCFIACPHTKARRTSAFSDGIGKMTVAEKARALIMVGECDSMTEAIAMLEDMGEAD